MYHITALIAACSLFVVSFPLFAKSPDDRANELEQQIIALQKTYTANNQDMVSAVAHVDAIRDEFTAMKGEVEATSHQLKAQREELMRLIADLQTRIQGIEDKMGIFSSQMTSAIGKVNPQAGAEAEIYQKALDLTNASKYLEAAAMFETLIQRYPKSQFAASSRFWVGECFYATRDLKRAIKEYQIFIEKNPKDPKVKDAILKQGNSFYELQMYDEARAFFEKVAGSYPGTQQAQLAKTKIAKIEARKGSKTSAPADLGPAPSSGDSISTYPTETIEQQRQKITGAKPAETPQAKPAEKKKPSLPARDF